MQELAQDGGFDLVERNTKKDPLSKAEAMRIVKAAGSVESLLNARHKIAKERGWGAKAPSRSAFAAAVVEEPNLLRRPVIARGDGALFSRNEAEIRAFLR